MAAIDPSRHGVQAPSSFGGRAVIALAPGVVAAGATALFDSTLLVAAAPLFAIGGLGVAGVIMALFLGSEQR